MHPKRNFLTRAMAAALCAVMLLTLCACHGRRGHVDPAPDPDPVVDPTPTPNPNPTPTPTPNPEPGPGEVSLKPSDVVDTFNVALLIDTSASLEASDPYGLALRSAVTFLESMYAGNANQERMLGAKHANVNIITYNDTVNPLFGQLYSLDDGGTVDELVKHIYSIERGHGGDSALGDALEMAVNMFSDLTQTPSAQGGGLVGFTPPPGVVPQGMMSASGSPLPGAQEQPPEFFGGREQNLIILFTDGYSKGGASQTAFEEIPAAPRMQNQPSAQMLSASPPQAPLPGQQEIEMPYFGGKTQAPLERALKKAQQRQCEIIVLGLNTSTNTVGGFDAYWNEFKKIANYTQVQIVAPPPPVLILPPDGNGMNRAGDQTDPYADLPFTPPPPLPPITGRVGGGMFESTDSDVPVNYKEAKTLMEAQRIYIQIASAMLQGTGTETPSAFLEGNLSSYKCNIEEYVSAVVFYVLSSDPNGVNVDDLIAPDGTSWRRKLNEGETSGANGWNSDHTVRRAWYSGCCVITVPNPAPGTWNLKAHTTSGNRSEFAVHMTQIGGIELDISFKQDERFADDGTIFVRAKSQSQYMSKDFYDKATASCALLPQPTAFPTNLGGMPSNGAGLMTTGSQDNGAMPSAGGSLPGLTGDVPMTYDPESNAMVRVYRAPFPGTYNVNVTLNSSNVDYHVSGFVNFEPRGEMPSGSEELYIRRKSIRLTPELTDSWKEIPLTVDSWTISPRNLLKVERYNRDDKTLVLEGLESGTGTLEVVVKGVPDAMLGEQTWILKYPVIVEK